MLACGAEEAMACRQPAARRRYQPRGDARQRHQGAGADETAKLVFLCSPDLADVTIGEMIAQQATQHVDVAPAKGGQEGVPVHLHAARREHAAPGGEMLIGRVNHRAIEVPEHRARFQEQHAVLHCPIIAHARWVFRRTVQAAYVREKTRFPRCSVQRQPFMTPLTTGRAGRGRTRCSRRDRCRRRSGTRSPAGRHWRG